MAGLIQIILDKLHNYQGRKRARAKEIDYTKQRILTGKIIIGVITEHIPVRKALLLFPKEGMKDTSIQAAWHALCHWEADEDIKAKDIQYANEQLELMELIAFTFKDGKELPENIIKSYEKYYDEALIPPPKGIQGMIERLTRFINT